MKSASNISPWTDYLPNRMCFWRWVSAERGTVDHKRKRLSDLLCDFSDDLSDIWTVWSPNTCRNSTGVVILKVVNHSKLWFAWAKREQKKQKVRLFGFSLFYRKKQYPYIRYMIVKRDQRIIMDHIAIIKMMCCSLIFSFPKHILHAWGPSNTSSLVCPSTNRFWFFASKPIFC